MPGTFNCDVCGRNFSQGNHLRRHSMIHTGERPYPCDLCDRRFYRKDKLTRHHRTHTNPGGSGNTSRASRANANNAQQVNQEPAVNSGSAAAVAAAQHIMVQPAPVAIQSNSISAGNVHVHPQFLNAATQQWIANQQQLASQQQITSQQQQMQQQMPPNNIPPPPPPPTRRQPRKPKNPAPVASVFY